MTSGAPDSSPDQPDPTATPVDPATWRELFSAECNTCGDRSDSEPGLPCGRLVGPPGHDDDHPDAVPCTGTYQPAPEPVGSPPSPTDPASWRELFTRMTPAMWCRFALLAAIVLAEVVIIGVTVVKGFTGD
jgi:hypothetical protein